MIQMGDELATYLKTNPSDEQIRADVRRALDRLGFPRSDDE